MNTRILQSYYRSDQSERLDPVFEPLYTGGRDYADFREIDILLDIYQAGAHGETACLGVLSYKFGVKAHLSGQEVLAFMQANPGYDVYFFNPFPQNAYYSFNVWDNGELWHQGLKDAAVQLFDKSQVGLSIDDLERHGHDVLLYCNFWIGNRRFWDSYVGSIVYAMREALRQDPGLKKMLAVPTPHSEPCSLAPFIFERVFTAYMAQRAVDEGIRALPYPGWRRADDYCLTEAERSVLAGFSDLIDAWDVSRSFGAERVKVINGLGLLVRDYASLYWKHHAFPF